MMEKDLEKLLETDLWLNVENSVVSCVMADSDCARTEETIRQVVRLIYISGCRKGRQLSDMERGRERNHGLWVLIAFLLCVPSLFASIVFIQKGFSLGWIGALSSGISLIYCYRKILS
jgi:hypothetical protein